MPPATLKAYFQQSLSIKAIAEIGEKI